MPKTALTELQRQVETIRREAFAAGYSAAMKAVRELASRSTAQAPRSGSAPTGRRRGRPRTRTAKPATPKSSRRTNVRSVSGASRTTRRAATDRKARSAPRRAQRGSKALVIEEILKLAAPNALRPTDIRKALQDKGVAISFAGISSALRQLKGRNAAELVGNSKTWRHRVGGARNEPAAVTPCRS
jgi:hypothetical protein